MIRVQPSCSRNAAIFGVAMLGMSMLGLVVGCDSAVPATSAAVDARFRLDSAPEDAVSLTDAAAQLTEAERAMPITLVGRIAGRDVSPFEPGRAIFMLSEAPAADHATDDPDHADNCPFCRRRAENAPTAMVEIVDPETDVVAARSADELLGLQVGDRVTLIGEASFNADLNLLQVKTSRLHATR